MWKWRDLCKPSKYDKKRTFYLKDQADVWGFPSSSVVKKKKKKIRMQCRRHGFDPLVSPGEGSGNRLQILAWRIPWTEEPGRLRSMVSQRVRHNWSDWAHTSWWKKQMEHHDVNKWEFPKVRGFLATDFLESGDSAKSSPPTLYPIDPACMHAKSLQSCLTLWDPIDGGPPTSSVPGILQQEHWSGLPFPSPHRPWSMVFLTSLSQMGGAGSYVEMITW